MNHTIALLWQIYKKQTKKIFSLKKLKIFYVKLKIIFKMKPNIQLKLINFVILINLGSTEEKKV